MIAEQTDLKAFQNTIEKELEIDAPVEAVFESILAEMNAIPDGSGKAMNLKLEAWPGGRWFRDLGEGVGHLWGHVQVIKPPALIEITGPLMMSMPVMNHVSYRILPADGGGSRLVFKHRAFGDIDPRMASGMNDGWGQMLSRVKQRAAK